MRLHIRTVLLFVLVSTSVMIDANTENPMDVSGLVASHLKVVDKALEFTKKFIDSSRESGQRFQEMSRSFNSAVRDSQEGVTKLA